MNLIQVSNDLKGLSDQQLSQEMLRPSGQVPSFLVLSELQRRKDTRQEFASRTQAPPNQSMAEQFAQQGAGGGLGAANTPYAQAVNGASAQGPQSPAAGPQQPNAGQPLGGMMAQPQAPQQPQGFAGGGIVRMQDGGDVIRAQQRAMLNRYNPVDPLILASANDPTAGIQSPFATPGSVRSRYPQGNPFAVFAGNQEAAGAPMGSDPMASGVPNAPAVPINIPQIFPQAGPNWQPPSPDAEQRGLPGAIPTDISGGPSVSAPGITGSPSASDPSTPAGLGSPAVNPAGARPVAGLPPGPGGGTRGGGGAAGSAGAPPIGLAATADSSLADYYNKIQGIKLPDRYAAITAANEADRQKLNQGLEEDKGLAIAKAGFAIAAGQSPYALSNIGAGAGEGIKYWSDAQKEFRQATRDVRNADNAIAVAQANRDERGLEMAVKTKEHAEEMYQRSQDRIATAGQHAASLAQARELKQMELTDNDKNRMMVREQATLNGYQTEAQKNYNLAEKYDKDAKDMTLPDNEKARLQGLAERYRNDGDAFSDSYKRSYVQREVREGHMVMGNIDKPGFDVAGNKLSKGQRFAIVRNGRMELGTWSE